MRQTLLAFVLLSIPTAFHGQTEELTWQKDTAANAHLNAREEKAIRDDLGLKPSEPLANDVVRIARKPLASTGYGIITQDSRLLYCGASGNCGFTIFGGTPQHPIPVLMASGIQTFEILHTSSHGYKDLELSRHGSAWDSDHFVMRFNGKRYRAVRCFERSYSRDEDESKAQTYRDKPFTCRGHSF